MPQTLHGSAILLFLVKIASMRIGCIDIKIFKYRGNTLPVASLLAAAARDICKGRPHNGGGVWPNADKSGKVGGGRFLLYFCVSK